VHGTRRQDGGARREASERVTLRAEGSEEVLGWTLNLSRGGVRIIVEDPVELGKDYEIRIGDAEPRLGRIVWVQDEADGQICGVQFLSADGTPVTGTPPPDQP
jgi:hypothetical protein